MVLVSWKDVTHPEAGGAEFVHHELSKRLVGEGHRVLHLVPGYRGCASRSVVDGIEIRRIGRSLLSFYALPFYFAWKLRRQTAAIVDVFVGVASFSGMLVPRSRRVLWAHHVQGPTWFVRPPVEGLPRPLAWLGSAAGWLLEKLQLRVLASWHRAPVMVGSASTATDLESHGFARSDLRAVPYPCPLAPLADLPDEAERFTVLLIGPRRVKRPLETLQAFDLFRRRHPDARLQIAGWGSEQDALRREAGALGMDVSFFGRIDEERKRELLMGAHVLCTSSVKEGFGLIVLEANAMGTPVIAHDVPGLRDALAHDNGLLYRGGPEGLASRLEALFSMWQDQPQEYERLRQRCLRAARRFDVEHSYRAFRRALPLGSRDCHLVEPAREIAPDPRREPQDVFAQVRAQAGTDVVRHLDADEVALANGVDGPADPTLARDAHEPASNALTGGGGSQPALERA